MTTIKGLRPSRNAFVHAAGLAVAVALVAFASLHLWSYDLRVPFTYHEADSVIMTVYVKGLIQDGWPNFISHLSAPYGYPAAAFPHLMSFDWAIIKGMSLFSHEPGLLLNAFWLLTLVLSAWTAAYAARQIGLSPAISFATGLLYAFLPFALIRNTHHLNLVYYLVPLLCLLAIVIATRGEGIRKPRQAVVLGLLACAAQGFDYVYFSFFAVLLFGMAVVVGYRRGVSGAFKLPAAAIGIVGLCTALNLMPALMIWRYAGQPVEMGYKSVAESEVYGAKLRRMVLPHPSNPLPPLAAYARRDAGSNFPIENENQTARLGLYGALGLLLIFLALARRNADGPRDAPAEAVQRLGLLTFLVITVGGFGTIINLLTVPDIRCYNRYSVYLSFFASAATGFWLSDRLAAMTAWRKFAAAGLAIGFVALSLYDQLLDLGPVPAHRDENAHRAQIERQAVTNLERNFPQGGAVLQLPLTGYPPIYQFENMESYDHGRVYLWSERMKWSWPSLTQQHRAWQDKLAKLEGADLVTAAVLSGFDAIWIDRLAYKDRGAALLSSLATHEAKQLDIGSERYAVIDLRQAAAAVKAELGDKEFHRRAEALLNNDAAVEWKKGFYDEERNPEGHRFHWAQDHARLLVGNAGERVLHICATMTIGSQSNGNVMIEGADAPFTVAASAKPETIHVPLTLNPHDRRTLEFSTGIPRANAPGDQRKLHFYVMDFGMETSRDGAPIASACAAKGNK